MSTVRTIKPERLVFGIYLLVVILIFDLVLHALHLPVWPVFLIMIFFFEAHMDRKRAPHLILGALFGIGCYILTVEFVTLAGPAIGLSPARLTFICIAVYAIVVFGEIVPQVFNNYAFTFFLVSGLAAQVEAATPQPYTWMAVAVVGGALVIASVLGIRTLMTLTHRAG